MCLLRSDALRILLRSDDQINLAKADLYINLFVRARAATGHTHFFLRSLRQREQLSLALAVGCDPTPNLSSCAQAERKR